jgi:hypothetical protein
VSGLRSQQTTDLACGLCLCHLIGGDPQKTSAKIAADFNTFGGKDLCQKFHKQSTFVSR